MKKILLAFSIIAFIASSFTMNEDTPSVKLGLIKYNGGGDWYSNPTSLPNLSRFCNKNLKTNIDPDYATVEVGSIDLFNYPFVHMTGHGNVVFSNQEIENLRNYLLAGGFLHIDDNYGMDQFIRTEMLKVFPELNWVELPSSHGIYNQTFDFVRLPRHSDQHLQHVHQHLALEDQLILPPHC